MREYAMNTTGIATEWHEESMRVANAVPETLPVTTMPVGISVMVSHAGPCGGLYTAHYDYQQVEGGFRLCLRRVTCEMPPITPHADPLRRGDQARIGIMDASGYFSATLEAEQRRKEWADIARQECSRRTKWY